MNFKKHLLMISISAALAACGGGSSSPSGTANVEAPIDNSGENTPTVQTQSVSGATADGYLVHAKVCLDINDNGACDDDEPYALSVDKGQYTIENISEGIDLNTVSVVVEVLAGQTIDEDQPGEVLEKSYRLTAPKGITKFISPITTLVSAELDEDDSITVEAAGEVVREKLGIVASDIDVMEDYVEAKKDEVEGEHYERIHKVAQVLAGVMADTDETLAESGDVVEGGAKEKLIAIRKVINEKLEEIVVIVDQKVDDDFDAKEAVEDFKEQVDVSLDEIDQKIKEERIAQSFESVAFTEVLENGGIYLIDGNKEIGYNEEAELCITEKEVSFEHASFSDGIVNVINYQYTNDTGSFVVEADEEDDLVWKGDTWQVASNDITFIETNDNGSITVTSDFDGEQVVSAKQVNITEKNIAELVQHNAIWNDLVSPETVFSEGAFAYKLSFTNSNDIYRLPNDENCQTNDMGGYEGGYCNHVYVTNSAGESSAVTAYEQLFSSVSSTENEQIFVELNDFYEKKVVMSLSGNATSTEGDAHFYLQYRERCDLAGCESQPLVLIGESSWEATAQGIEYQLPAQVRSWMHDRENSQVLTLHDGFIKKAYKEEAKHNQEYRWSFNGIAIEEIKSVFNADGLRTEVESKYCGVYDDKEKEDKNTETGGHNFTNDPSLSERLINKQYFFELYNEQVLITFSEDQSLYYSRQNSKDTDSLHAEYIEGEWLVTDYAKLVIYLEGEEHPLYFYLKEDTIGENIMTAPESDSGEGNSFAMIAVRNMNASDLVAMPNFSLTSLVDEDCVVSLYTNATPNNEVTNQGGGYAEMQGCDEESTQADFTWHQEGTLQFTVYEPEQQSYLSLYLLADETILATSRDTEGYSLERFERSLLASSASF